MSRQLGSLIIASGVKDVFKAPNTGVKAILIGNDSGLTCTITMESGGVEKTLYPGMMDWFQVNTGFTGNIKIRPYTVLNNVAAWPASSLIFDAIGTNDPEHSSSFPITLFRVINAGNSVVVGGVVTTTPLTLYGTNSLDATLTNAGDMATAAGGVETNSVDTIGVATHEWLELVAKTSTNDTVTSIPTLPTGKGWVWFPGFALTFVASNWNAFLRYNQNTAFSTVGKMRIRFFKLPAGVLANAILMGAIEITGLTLQQSKDLFTFPATAVGMTSLASNDGLYVDGWVSQATGGAWIGIANAKVFESTSASTGVANDMQVVTGGYTKP